jgi:hypothetical protein
MLKCRSSYLLQLSLQCILIQRFLVVSSVPYYMMSVCSKNAKLGPSTDATMIAQIM